MRVLLGALCVTLLATTSPQPPAALVDHHQHLFSPAIAERNAVPAVDAAQLIALLDAAGIQKAIVLSLAYQWGNPNRPPIDNEYAHVKTENDWTSEQVARFPDRLRAFCSVNPLKAYALEEIARCAQDPRLRLGLKLHFGNSDVEMGNPQHVARLREVFRAANTHKMAIVVHLRSSVNQKRTYGAPHATVFLEQVLPEAPDVPVQIAHLTGAGGYEDARADEALEVFIGAIAKKDPRMAHVWFDISGVAGLGNWKARADVIVKRIRDIGVERVLYGSDGVGGKSPTPEQAWTAFTQLPLAEREIRAIGQNVAPYMATR